MRGPELAPQDRFTAYRKIFFFTAAPGLLAPINRENNPAFQFGARCIGDVRALARRLPGQLLTRVPLGVEAIVALEAPVAAHDLSKLTAAERAVAHDLVCALSHGEIARRRRRSVRTVANQISSIYKKLKVSDRNELITLLRAT